MLKIMFVCLGNICRSPMAEAIMAEKIRLHGLGDKIKVSSAATSSEEEGSGIHYGTVNKLKQKNIPVPYHRAVPLCGNDYNKYDMFIGMDERNLRAMARIFKEDKNLKIKRLLDFSSCPRDIADPWYTGNFDKTYDDIEEGCEALLQNIIEIKLK